MRYRYSLLLWLGLVFISIPYSKYWLNIVSIDNNILWAFSVLIPSVFIAYFATLSINIYKKKEK